MEQIRGAIRRILSISCMAMVIMSQLMLVLPSSSYAATAGEDLVIRVQYYGEAAAKIREKVTFTRSELESMGPETHYYSNITSVGTVMSLAARGPRVMTILERAGIDTASIQNITFRTTDGYTRNFTVEGHLTATKYFYPHLSSCYERNSEDESMTLTDGAISDRETVPAILALECGESKAKETNARDLPMATKKAYRFCMGQSDLELGPVDLNSNVVSSIDSCYSIYGIDVTLYGSPPEDEEDMAEIDNHEKKVGSKKKSIDNKKEQKVQADTQSAEKVTIKTREIRIGDKIVEDVSPQEKLRNNMAEDAEELAAAKQYSRGAAIATGVGAGLLFSIGALARLIKYMKWR